MEAFRYGDRRDALSNFGLEIDATTIEGHHYIVKNVPSINNKSSLVLIRLMHKNLIITRVDIYHRKDFISGRAINEFINGRNGITVFWAGFVKFYKIQ